MDVMAAHSDPKLLFVQIIQSADFDFSWIGEVQAMAEKKDNRKRSFATIVYPESAPEDWQSILADQFIPAFISPLHDKDLTAAGDPKKAHYHVMLMFEGKKSLEQVQEVFSLIGGVGLKVLESQRGYARYLCHMDDPDKAQYDAKDVRALCGADYAGVVGMAVDRYKAIGEMIDYCEEKNILSYSKLLVYARMERYDWFRILCDNGTVVMREYLKSRSWAHQNERG